MQELQESKEIKCSQESITPDTESSGIPVDKIQAENSNGNVKMIKGLKKNTQKNEQRENTGSKRFQ